MDDADLASAAAALVRALAASSTSVCVASRELVRSAVTRSFAEQLEVEAASIAGLAGSEDGREGIRAFLAGRVPNFSGARAADAS